MSQQKRIQLKAYDKLLKSFQYREALDAAISTDRPEIVSSIVEELAARSGLPAALGEPSVLAFAPLVSLACPPLHLWLDPPCIFAPPPFLASLPSPLAFWCAPCPVAGQHGLGQHAQRPGRRPVGLRVWAG